MPAWDIFIGNVMWMSWNAALAFLPFLLASFLFKPKTRKNLVWSIGFIIFILFLPNAPYIFTDVIHLPEDWLQVSSKSSFLVITWQYLGLFVLGYYLFCKSYFKFENFVLHKISKQHKVWIRVMFFMVISIGVYLGRFPRFNSWDILLQPLTLLSVLAELLMTPKYLGFIGLYTLVLYVSYLSYIFIHYQKEKILKVSFSGRFSEQKGKRLRK